LLLAIDRSNVSRGITLLLALVPLNNEDWCQGKEMRDTIPGLDVSGPLTQVHDLLVMLLGDVLTSNKVCQERGKYALCVFPLFWSIYKTV